MRLRKLVFLTSILMLVCAFAAAQTQPSETDADKAKKKKDLDDRVVQMLDETAAGAAGLRLPGNRAIVDAMSADIYWKIDEKRARELFKTAASEIITYNAETEKERAESTQPDYNIYDQDDPRNDVLQLIAKHDVDLALEILLQTRSARLAESMARAAAAGGVVDVTSSASAIDNARTIQETQLEQNFSQRAAANDPDKIVKLIKDSMAKGVTTGLIQLLQNLNQKDSKKAAELGSDVIAKLSDADFVKNQNDVRTALSYLQYAAGPLRRRRLSRCRSAAPVKPFAFADAQMKGLAGKLVDALLVPSKSMMGMTMITSALPTLEKFVPERVAALKARDAENKKSLPTEMKASMGIPKAFDPNTTPEDLIALLGKSTNENEKRMMNQALAQKISQITDEARAKKLIDQIPDEKTRATAQEQFDAMRISRAAAAGKVDEARGLIRTMTNRKIQIQRLVALAVQVQRTRKEKDIETAKDIMNDAKGNAKDFPDDEDDLADMMEVIRGYAAIDPDTAFRMFEPLVDEFNNIVQAAAVMSKYNKRDRTFKKGELVMKLNGNFVQSFGGGTSLLLFRYIPQIQMLGKADLERMSVLSDRFSRGDARTIVKLFVLQGFLAEDRKPAVQGGTGGIGMGVRP